MILGFCIYAWITIATVLVTFGILLFTRLRSDLVFLGVIGVLFVTGVLNANEALSGFSSTTVAMVGETSQSNSGQDRTTGRKHPERRRGGLEKCEMAHTVPC